MEKITVKDFDRFVDYEKLFNWAFFRVLRAPGKITGPGI
jgi:hypothetical protein